MQFSQAITYTCSSLERRNTPIKEDGGHGQRYDRERVREGRMEVVLRERRGTGLRFTFCVSCVPLLNMGEVTTEAGYH